MGMHDATELPEQWSELKEARMYRVFRSELSTCSGQ